MNHQASVEETEHELLAAAAGELPDPNLDLAPEVMRQLVMQMREKCVLEFHAHQLAARLSDLVDDKKNAESRRTMAKNLVVQIHALDKELAQLPAPEKSAGA